MDFDRIKGKGFDDTIIFIINYVLDVVKEKVDSYQTPTIYSLSGEKMDNCLKKEEVYQILNNLREKQ